MVKKALPILFLGTILLLGFSSCRKTLCKNVDCGHGVCAYGICECEEGWGIGADGKCTKEQLCFGVDCGHGTCDVTDGSCLCDLDYELDTNGKCNRLWREKFLGTWTGSHIDDNNDTVGPYTMIVTAVSSDIQKVQISNFVNYLCGFTGTGLVVNGRVTFEERMAYFDSFCAGVSTSGSITSLDESHFSTSIWLALGSGNTHSEGLFVKQ